MRNKKFKRLTVMLFEATPDETPITTLGRLVALWSFAFVAAPDGRLCDFSDEQIAEEMHWRGDPATLVQALRVSGFVTGRWATLNDWHEWGGRLHEKRTHGRLRVQQFRKNRNGDVTVTSALRNRQVTRERRGEEK